MAESARERYQRIHAKLWTERTTFVDHWRELSDFVTPRRARFLVTDRNRGDKRHHNIIDSTGRFAHRTLQSGLHAGLTSPARPWMKLTTPDPDLADFGPVKEWLHVVTQRMLAVFLQSNLYNALPVVYGDIGLFAVGAMAVLEDTKDLFRTYTFPIGSYALGVNARGVVSTFVREYESTVRQVVETHGVRSGYRDIDWSRLSSTVKGAWDRGDYENPVTMRWIVMPNEEADDRRLGAKYLPFKSCHYEAGSEPAERSLQFTRESGFRHFPIMAPRWDVTSHEDAYGTDCPGMTALGDIKQLQMMGRKKGQAIAKWVDPSLKGPVALKQQKTSLLPGDVTYVDDRQDLLKPIHEIELAGLQFFIEDIRDVRFLVRRAFYEDLFLMLASSDPQRGVQPPTAEEIRERHEEKLIVLGPVLERQNDELLDPLVDRAYAMMELAGLVPPPPEELHGVTLKVEYTSILAQAQRLVGVTGQDRFIQSIGLLTTTYPEARFKLDPFQAADNYAEMLGVDPRLVRPNEDAQELADAEAEAKQSALEAQNAAELGKAVQSAGATPLGNDTVLNALVRQVRG